jgi:hypothetical protein
MQLRLPARCLQSARGDTSDGVQHTTFTLPLVSADCSTSARISSPVLGRRGASGRVQHVRRRVCSPLDWPQILRRPFRQTFDKRQERRADRHLPTLRRLPRHTHLPRSTHPQSGGVAAARQRGRSVGWPKRTRPRNTKRKRKRKRKRRRHWRMERKQRCSARQCVQRSNARSLAAAGTHFTCFTSTKVQILTPDELRARSASSFVLNLLALLVQNYK